MDKEKFYDIRPVTISRLLKPAEVSEILSVSRSFAYQLMQTGALPVVRLGKVRRVRPQDLQDYIDQNLQHKYYG